MLRIREKGVAIMSQDNGKGLAIASMVLGIVGVAATGLVVLCAICAVGTLAAAGSIS